MHRHITQAFDFVIHHNKRVPINLSVLFYYGELQNQKLQYDNLEPKIHMDFMNKKILNKINMTFDHDYTISNWICSNLDSYLHLDFNTI